MLPLERQSYILEHLKERKAASIAELAKRLYIGEATIRRDLDKLARQNLIKRTYGGAVLTEGLNTEIPISVREKEQSLSKDRIGRLAADFVRDGDIIILDSSTTTYAMIPYLKNKLDLTVVTNGLKTAGALGNALHAKVYCTGGKLRENSLSLVGQGARSSIDSISAQKLFFSCRGISPGRGAMDSSEEEAELRGRMINSAEQIFLLCDGSKLHQKAFYKICGFDQIDCLITDAEPDAEIRQALTKNRAELHY